MIGIAADFGSAVANDLAGDGAYHRGVAYYRDGRVEVETLHRDRAVATVRGTLPYHVELASDDGALSWWCSCPAAENGAFCKHCVAVAMAVEQHALSASAVPDLDATMSDALDDDLRPYVFGLDRERLAGIVMGQIAADIRLRDRLIAQAAAESGRRPSIEDWKRRIDRAFAPYGDFVSYRDAPEWAERVHEVVAGLGALADAGFSEVVVDLTEYALNEAEAAIGYVDDSDGWITDISNRLADLHRGATASAHPDPVDLARRLVDYELTMTLDVFRRAASTYAGVLGADGLAAYRSRLDEEARDVRQVDADEPDAWSRRWALHHAMVGWALGSGDPDALIEVVSDDRWSPPGGISLHDHVDVARTLADAGRIDEAITWARSGIEQWRGRRLGTSDLDDLLARLLRSVDDESGAADVFWDAFIAAPSVGSYRRLLAEDPDHADEWRTRCVTAMRNRLVEHDDHPMAPHPEARVLVQTMMFEGDIDGAWEVATSWGADDQSMMALARAREPDHPLDAAEVYEDAALVLIARTERQAYERAVELMARIERLADAAGSPGRFSDLLERVRTEHRAKRTLQGLLDDRGWP